MRRFDGSGPISTVFLTGLLLAILVGAAAPAGATIKELANDSFIGLGSVVCTTGFLEGESAAARLTADPGDYPYQVRKIRMLVCPAPVSGYVTLRIYEDNSGTVNPGPVLYEEIVQVTGSDDALNELDLTSYNIIIPSGSVRIELEWFQNGPPGPGIARDLDGFVPGVNFIYAWLDPPGIWLWVYADQLGVTGDWIIRMEIDTLAETPIFADGFESGGTTMWSDTSP